LPTLSARTALFLHLAFESLAYAVAFAIYRRERRRDPAPALTPRQSPALLLGATVGALVGARLLAWAEAQAAPGPPLRFDLLALHGKTIVGGLLGGWIGVEIAKRRVGVHRPTGDAFVPALLAGLAVGRIGCFLAGLHDGTYGRPTALPWGMDFGDGVARHPTQLYEIAFLALLAAALRRARRPPRPAGELFLFAVAGYLSFRAAVDFLKPRPIVLLGLDAIQAASFLGAAAALVLIARRRATVLAAPERVLA
jgi:phosphatidylglycerol---prolipoprotein diacylglyceryl transferase